MCDYFKEASTCNNENYTLDNTEFLNGNDFLNNQDNILNSQITQEEIKICIKSLKNGKAAGIDHILNEYIKSTSHKLLPLYVSLFNLILDTGILPIKWKQGIIILICIKIKVTS